MPYHESPLQRIHELEAELREKVLQIERARNYKSIDSSGCPLCTYVDGVFKSYCQPHYEMCELREELQQKERLLCRYQKALETIADDKHGPYYPDGDAMSENMCAKIALGTNCPDCGTPLPCPLHKEQPALRPKCGLNSINPTNGFRACTESVPCPVHGVADKR